MERTIIGFVLAFGALAGTAGGALAAPPPTIQGLFDQAADASARGDDAAALAGYDEIERRIGKTGRPATLAIMRARRGDLLNTLGRTDEAVVALRYAQANLPAGDEILRGDRLTVALALGEIAERALDYPAAVRSYRIAETEAAEPRAKRIAWAGQARVTMFDDPEAALRLMDRALAVPAADPAEDDPVKNRAVEAQYRQLRARALMNAGRAADARRELDVAVRGLGGLTTRLDLADVAVRSDMAIAALLTGDKDAARKYMAFTGAGTQREVLPIPHDGMDVPRCGGDAGLRPEDVAVVQFSIAADGAVIGASPIYASRSGPAAIAFARSVAGWAWTADQVAKMRPFFRLGNRVELRCSTAQDRPSVVDLLEADMRGWRPDDPSLKLLTARSGAADAVRLDAARQALARAEAAHAPPRAIAFLLIHEAYGARDGRYDRRGRERVIAALTVAADRPSLAGDRQAQAAIRLAAANEAAALRDNPLARSLLDPIAADTGLAATDPLKVGALLRLAALRAQAGDMAGARADYDRTGLSAQECALVDLKPALVHANAGPGQFPREAMQWNFEGWTQTEFDVAASGRTQNVRATVAYPPFVFGPASVGVIAGSQFTQSYRPEGGLGCGGQVQNVRFGSRGSK